MDNVIVDISFFVSMRAVEVHTFCPADARIWNDNCQDVQFMNYTAISMNNEMAVISAFNNTILGLLAAYPSSIEDDKRLLADHYGDIGEFFFRL